MFYEIVKVFNNNVILIKNNIEQCVLISKGVGFSKKAKDLIDVSAITETKKFFYTNESSNLAIKGLEDNINIIEKIAHQIIHQANLQLSCNFDALFQPIFDHLVFIVGNLKSKSPLQNPFVNEIKILCSKEFDIISSASKSIENELNVRFLDGEKAFLALILYSGSKKQTIPSVTVDIMIYSKIFEILSNISYTNESYRSFILSVNSLIASLNSKKNYMFTDNLIQNIQNDLSFYYNQAILVSNLLKNELSLDTTSDTFVSLLAIEIYKLDNS